MYQCILAFPAEVPQVPFDTRRFRNAFGRFPTGVVIVTAVTPDGARIGMTVSSFNSVSLDPPLVLFSVHRQAHTFPIWQRIGSYAINILSEEQETLSNQFARAKGEKWDGVMPLTGATGVPIMPNACAVLECQAHARHDGGDHEIFVGRVMEIHDHSVNRGRPLVFFEGRYRQLAGATTAHNPPEDAVLLHGW
jgi:flavin reductase (DIM6/NTAB) family NADH-FMN oxidoreductase RutF